MSRFDYVKYDEVVAAIQADFKAKFEELDVMISDCLKGTFSLEIDPDETRRAFASHHIGELRRYQALYRTNLEVVYMYTGKTLREVQNLRNGHVELQEGRGNE